VRGMLSDRHDAVLSALAADQVAGCSQCTVRQIGCNSCFYAIVRYGATHIDVEVTEEERMELERRLKAHTTTQRDHLRAVRSS
jgi:hypothetical protein